MLMFSEFSIYLMYSVEVLTEMDSCKTPDSESVYGAGWVGVQAYWHCLLQHIFVLFQLHSYYQ